MKEHDQYIYQGIKQIFDRFVLVDLKEGTYQYLDNTIPQFDAIALSGSYEEFVEFIVSMIEKEDQAAIRPLLAKENVEACLSSGGCETLRYGYYINRDTKQWENINIICLEREQERPVKVLFTRQDVTELKEKELQKQYAIERQYRAQLDQNMARTQFFSRMSHDIRTPLNAIMGMTSVAMMHLDDEERVKDCLEKIQVSSHYLLGLVNSVLDMSALEGSKVTLEEKSFNMVEMAEEMRAILAIQSKQKSLHTTVEVEVFDHADVLGDKQRLEQIVINVVGNAFKYTPQGGKVDIKLEEIPSLMKGYACFCLTCKDSGIGMIKEDVDKIFEPFHRAKQSLGNTMEGTGLGMPIAYSLARLMYGDIKVESTLGEGTTFVTTFYLKINNNDSVSIHRKEVAATMEQSENYSAGRGTYPDKHILVVEDNYMNLEIATEFLKLLEVQIDTAEDAKEAITKVLQSTEGYYDLILMDIQLPQMTGYEVTRCIRQSGRKDLLKVPIIAMTANAFREDVQMAAEAGMNGHLSKPIEMDTLLDCVEEWISR